MPAREALKELGERKRLLLLESNLHRTLIRAELAESRLRIDDLKSGFSVLQKARSVLGNASTPTPSFADTASRFASWVALGVSAWKLWQSIKSLRRASSVDRKHDDPDRAR